MKRSVVGRLIAAAVVVAAVVVVVVVSGSSDDDSTTSTTPQKSEKILIGFGDIGGISPIITSLETVFKEQARARGWEMLILDNRVDGPTALKNANTMIARGVKYAVEFQADSKVQPVIASRFKSAGIPELVFDIPAPGAYFIGAPNKESGELVGRQLGSYAEERWNCEPDLVVLIEATSVGEVNDLRVGGVEDGLKSVCPNIPDSKIVRRDGGASADDQQAAGRDVLVANPKAKRILVSGISDASVAAVIAAAKQLGRADELYAWGQDGSVLLGGEAPPELRGSVSYFLNGYPLIVFDIIDRLERGEDVPVGDTPGHPDANLVKPCMLSAAQARELPSIEEQTKLLSEAEPGQQAYDLLCPQE